MSETPEASRARDDLSAATPEPRMAVAVTLLAGLWLTATYFFYFGFTAWHPSDYEYVMACMYRIVHGELPYRDFIYHKPPGTLYLHLPLALLPGSSGVVISRFVFYLQLTMAGFVPIAWALQQRRVAFGWRLPLLGLMTVAVALHNHPAMSWQTSDGVFFSMLGVVAWADSLGAANPRRALVMRAAASLLLLLAVLCKQSFIGICVVFAIASALEYVVALWKGRARGYAFAVLCASAAPALICLVLLGIAFAQTGMLEHFLLQIASQGDSGTIVQRLGSYADSRYLWTLPVWIAMPGLRLVDASGYRGALVRVLGAVALCAFALGVIVHQLDPLHALGELTLFALLGTLLGRLAVALLASRFLRSTHAQTEARALTQRPMLLLHAGSFLTAWLCLLSLGYPSPLLGIAGLGLVLHEVLPQARTRLLDVAPAALASIAVLLAYLALNEARPYRDKPREELTHDLGAIFPKLAGIATNEGQYRRYQELVALAERHALARGRRFVVTQDYPGIHWLMNQPNAWAIDWAYPPEPDGFEPRLIADLARTRPIAIVPKAWTAPVSFMPPLPCAQVRYGAHNLFSRMIARNWSLLEDSHDFCVFELPAAPR